MGLKDYLKNNENKYIIYSAIFAVIYFFFILPYLVKQFGDTNLILQFLIFNVGVLAVLCIYLKAKSLSIGVNLVKAIEYMFVVIAINIWIPDYHVDFMTGALIKGGALGISTSDYLAGYFATNTLHLTGFLIVGFTYLVVPITLLFIAKTIGKSNFVRGI